MTPKIIHSLSEISELCGDIYIYGKGLGGETIFHVLPYDIRSRVVGFLDTYASGEYLGLPVYRSEQFLPTIPSDSIIILASVFEEQILNTISIFGAPTLTVLKMWDFIEAGAYCYGEDESSSAKDKCRNIVERLEDTASKDLYQKLFNTRIRGDLGDHAYNLKADQEFRTHFLDKIGGEEYLALVGAGIYLDYLVLENIETVIEGGLYDGYNTHQFVPVIGPKGKIYSFEPNYDELASGLAHDPRKGMYLKYLSKHPCVEIIAKGLMDTEREVRFGGNGQADMQRVIETGGRVVQVTSVDQFTRERNLDRVDLIKLDIEGAEPDCLKGAEQTLLTLRPQLAISIYHTKEQFLDIPYDLMERLDNYAFYLGHYCALPRYDTVLYAVPRELLST